MKAHDPKPVPRYRLRPWEVKLAAWEAEHERSPIAVQLDVASRLAARPVTYGMVKHLRKRADYREVRDTFRTGGVEAARRLFVSDLPTYAELFRWGAEHAKETGDHRGLATYAVAAADRILPKREALDIAALNQTIVLHMTEKQLAQERAEPIETTWEAIPNPNVPQDVPEAAPKALPENTVMPLTEALRRRRDLEQPSRPVDLWND